MGFKIDKPYIAKVLKIIIYPHGIEDQIKWTLERFQGL